MLALTIAIAALLVAVGVGVCVRIAVNRIEAAIAELAESEEEDEEEEAKDPPHIWVGDGECYIVDMAAFLTAIGAAGMCNYEGVPCAVIPGTGVVSLHKLFSESAKTDAANVRAIKP